jgi:hypothetical protein
MLVTSSGHIAPLVFDGIRIVSYPDGQQYGAISPCEMNEFSDECEAWEQENGPYQRGVLWFEESEEWNSKIRYSQVSVSQTIALARFYSGMSSAQQKKWFWVW